MRSGPLPLLALMLCGVISSAQSVSAEQRPAVNALVKFLHRYGQPGEADSVRQDFEQGRLRIAPVPENDNADTDTDRGLITLNPRLLQEIQRADGQQSFKATADWAATIRHERVHAQQSTRSVIASNIRRTLGLGCPHEVEGWHAGFQSYYDWIERLRKQMASGGSELEREAAAADLRDLTKGFQEYRQNYTQGNFGDMRLTDRDGVTIGLDEAAREVEKIRKATDLVLERAGFVVNTLPRVHFPKAGETYTVSAYARGGAFDENGKGDKDRLYTYAWFVDGANLGVAGRTITRSATKSETLTVEVMDRLGRKSSSSCKVTVEGAPAPSVDSLFIQNLKRGMEEDKKNRKAEEEARGRAMDARNAEAQRKLRDSKPVIQPIRP